MNFIILFRKNYLTRLKYYRALITIIILLEYNSPKTITRGTNLYPRLFNKIIII